MLENIINMTVPYEELEGLFANSWQEHWYEGEELKEMVAGNRALNIVFASVDETLEGLEKHYSLMWTVTCDGGCVVVSISVAYIYDGHLIVENGIISNEY